jgi:hypothetical protein
MENLPETTVEYYLNQMSINFNSDKEKNDFIKYCDYMMFSNYEKPYPVPEEDIKDNFRYLYKYIEMLFEEDIMKQHYYNEITCDFDDYYNNENYNEECDEDIYLNYIKLY